jgi:hypothetical protein
VAHRSGQLAYPTWAAHTTTVPIPSSTGQVAARDRGRRTRVCGVRCSTFNMEVQRITFGLKAYILTEWATIGRTTGPQQYFKSYRTRHKQTYITGPRQSFKRYQNRYKQTSPVLDNLSSLIGLDTNKHTRPDNLFSLIELDNLFSFIELDSNKRYRSSTILSAILDSIQIIIIGTRQPFQPSRARYKHTLPVFDNLFSLIGLYTNNPYRSSTILSALSESIPTNFNGP